MSEARSSGGPRVFAGEGRGEHLDRGSRFLSYGFPIEDGAAFSARLQQIRREHPKASHHCWAWRLLDAHRFHDDGEPGGTAGRPLFQVLDGERLVQSAIVVVRYFGGVKLGTGGLVRAYTAAAQRAVGDAGLRAWVQRAVVELFLPYELLGLREELAALYPELSWRGERFVDAGWAGEGHLPNVQIERLRAFLEQRGRGQARLRIRGTRRP